MTIEFRMPSLGPDMEADTLVEWRVKPGDRVKHGDVVALVETDKGVIDVEVFSDAVVERLLLEPGVKVPVGEPLAHLSGEAPEPRAVSSAGIVALPVAPPVAVPASGPHPVSRSGRVRISPAARA